MYSVGVNEKVFFDKISVIRNTGRNPVGFFGSVIIGFTLVYSLFDISSNITAFDLIQIVHFISTFIVNERAKILNNFPTCFSTAPYPALYFLYSGDSFTGGYSHRFCPIEFDILISRKNAVKKLLLRFSDSEIFHATFLLHFLEIDVGDTTFFGFAGVVAAFVGAGTATKWVAALEV